MDTMTSGPPMAAPKPTLTRAGEQAWRDILFKTGRVLFIAGLIDVAVMVICIATGTPYAAMLNVFAVVGGWFLMKESLKTANIVRWIGTFSLSALLVVALASPWSTPWDLTVLQFRLQPWPELIASASSALAALAVVAWVTLRLGRPEVLAARAAHGLKRRDMRIPLAVGATLAVALMAGVQMGLNGDSAKKAERMAREHFGDGYRYQAVHVGVFYSQGVTRHQVMVTVYNDTGFRNVPVQWVDQ
jgi:hypothetical protein